MTPFTTVVTGAEIDFLAQQIKGLTFRIDQDASLSNYDLQLTYRVKKFIDAVATNFNWSFGTDDRLLNNLTAHMQIALQRNGVNGPVPPEGSIRNLFATILNNEINDYEFFKTIGKLNQGLAISASDEQSYFLNLLDAQTLIICYQAVRSLKKKYFSSVPDGQL
ncbi:hypothetical protein WP50_00625, partial [Lactiplantibacillus plantarum]